MKYKDNVGDTYNRLTIDGYISGTKNKPPRYQVTCVCGSKLNVICKDVLRGHSKSCGCYQREVSLETLKKHNLIDKNPYSHKYKLTYTSWLGIKERCLNPKGKDFKYWGGRGIKVCVSWMEFKNFLQDMGERPSAEYQIDRIDNDKDYAPDNCRWLKGKENQRNKRQAKSGKPSAMKVQYEGQDWYVRDLADMLNVSRYALYKRIKRNQPLVNLKEI